MMANLAHNSGIAAIALSCVLFLEASIPLPPGGTAAGSVSNIRFESGSDRITLYYDLAGSNDQQFKVTVSLRKEKDPGFTYNPKDLQGDAGTGYFAGKNRKIVWTLSSEFPQGLAGTDYYFEISAEEASSSDNQMLLWIGAGVLFVGGAVAAVVLASPGTQASSPTGGFPKPPGRP
jgi:hypothetical protein